LKQAEFVIKASILKSKKASNSLTISFYITDLGFWGFGVMLPSYAVKYHSKLSNMNIAYIITYVDS
jgi:hypothetical protein